MSFTYIYPLNSHNVLSYIIRDLRWRFGVDAVTQSFTSQQFYCPSLIFNRKRLSVIALDIRKSEDMHEV